jgi:Rps23 Pro-64 3,4-dihydroxylase Tpa1-like proline 4-hydroxylase
VSIVSQALAREREFLDASVIAPAAPGAGFEIGKSRVLTNLGAIGNIVEGPLQNALPQALKKLRIQSFHVSRLDAQMTSTNDGETLRFRGSPERAELTFVFVCFREPKGFSGGDIRVYDARLQRGHWVPADTYKTISVRQNMLVMFPSRFSHEITPVRCRSNKFADSLFTITGWLFK